MQSVQSDIQAQKVVPKSTIGIGFGALIVFMAPLIYHSFKTQAVGPQLQRQTKKEQDLAKREGMLLLESETKL